MHEEGVRNGYCCQLDKGNNTWLLKNNKDVKHLDRESVSGENNKNDKVRCQKKTILFGNFSQHGGGVFPNPKTFVNLKNSAFLGQKQCFLGKKCTITWYLLHNSLS